MSNVEPHDDHATRSVLKTGKEKLVVGGYIEDVFYVLDVVPPCLQTRDRPPVVGESFAICHHFQPYRGGMYSYEHLFLFIGRKTKKSIHNYVRYFKTLQEMEDVLGQVVAHVDMSYADRRIRVLQTEIDQLRESYARAYATCPIPRKRGAT